jgi:nucleotide-binding universal stress UspA family protein
MTSLGAPDGGAPKSRHRIPTLARRKDGDTVKTILVPLDGSPASVHAATIAAGVAPLWGADLVIATVASLPDQAELDLQEVRRQVGVESARIEVIRSTDVLGTIADLVESFPDPVICMTAHGRGALSRAIVGGVTEQTLECVSCPVLLVGPQCAPTWPAHAHRMLACLDESETSNPIIEPAAAWAHELGLELWLAEIFHTRDVDSHEAPYRFLDTVVARLRPELPDVRACVSWNSDVAGEIVHLARSLSVSMVVMGTHGLEGFERFAFGSVAMSVVHRAPCPVLVVGPAARHRAGEPSTGD